MDSEGTEIKIENKRKFESVELVDTNICNNKFTNNNSAFASRSNVPDTINTSRDFGGAYTAFDTSNFTYVNSQQTFIDINNTIQISSDSYNTTNVRNDFGGEFTIRDTVKSVTESFVEYDEYKNTVCSVDSLYLECLSALDEVEQYHGFSDGRKRNKGSPRRKTYSDELKKRTMVLKDGGLSTEHISHIIDTAKSNIEKWCSKKVRRYFLKCFTT